MTALSGCGSKVVSTGAASDYQKDKAQAGDLKIQKARGFELETLDGKTVSLEEHLGHPIVLNFWASWCTPCKEEAAVFGAVHRDYKDSDVVFIGIAVRDTKKDARAFVKKYKIDYTIGFDPASQVATTYEVGPIPETFFIDKEGVIKARWFGAVPEDKLVENIEAMLND